VYQTHIGNIDELKHRTASLYTDRGGLKTSRCSYRQWRRRLSAWTCLWKHKGIFWTTFAL